MSNFLSRCKTTVFFIDITSEFFLKGEEKEFELIDVYFEVESKRTISLESNYSNLFASHVPFYLAL